MNHSKKLPRWALCLLFSLGVSSAQAHGPRGYVGVHYGWGGYYDPWLAPALVGTAIVGTSIYMSRPHGVVQPSTVYVHTLPPAVIVSQKRDRKGACGSPIALKPSRFFIWSSTSRVPAPSVNPTITEWLM